ncbi:hypothetical protein WJX72_010934 [[Myrmecia] bisecta]|uniref:Uncharacterized protein n=1 Tax=[Myrmecia] bisecta TaxID=41462 RepID=A0AAW1NYD5_9CHLO
MGTLLREAGVPCDLTVKAGGKHTWIASHERDVTRMHYLTLATDAVHRMGGFGPEWSSAHLLGRSGHDTLRLKAGGQL